jgi:hypothetical protein
MDVRGCKKQRRGCYSGIILEEERGFAEGLRGIHDSLQLPRIDEAPRALDVRPNYSLTSARAIFCEMYPSTAPMIIEMTMLMNGLSSEAMVTEPSLLPAKASPAVVA